MKNKDKIFLYLAAVPLMAGLMLFWTAGARIDAFLSPQEKRLLAFHSEPVPNLAERPVLDVKAIPCPLTVKMTSAKAVFPDTPLTHLSPPPSGKAQVAEKRISMILMNKTKKLAIIDGKLVNEGERLGDSRIVSIEKNRILLRNKKGNQWLNFE